MTETARKKKSGPTKSYAQRKAEGLTPVFIWLSPASIDTLDGLCAEHNVSRQVAIEGLIEGRAWSVRVDGTLARADRQPQRSSVPVAGDLDDLAPDEDDVEPTARSVAEPGSAAELAQRVRSRSRRREATIVATGERVADGRVVR